MSRLPGEFFFFHALTWPVQSRRLARGGGGGGGASRLFAIDQLLVPGLITMDDENPDSIRKICLQAFLAISICINLIIVACIALAIYLVSHRHDPLMKRLSWRLMLITLTGLSILAVGVQLYHYSSEEEEWKCTALPFILGTGFILTFSPLLARSIRIRRIFMSMKRCRHSRDGGLSYSFIYSFIIELKRGESKHMFSIFVYDCLLFKHLNKKNHIFMYGVSPSPLA